MKYLKVAKEAIHGDKLFALTHSSIVTYGYPNTTETIGELIKLAGVDKEIVVSDGPRAMEQVYEANSGDFHVKGYLGVAVKDHIDHIWGMNETLLPYLRDRWSR
jgi:5,10-methenyltetrahydromethanopterin hydrogenase